MIILKKTKNKKQKQVFLFNSARCNDTECLVEDIQARHPVKCWLNLATVQWLQSAIHNANDARPPVLIIFLNFDFLPCCLNWEGKEVHWYVVIPSWQCTHHSAIWTYEVQRPIWGSLNSLSIFILDWHSARFSLRYETIECTRVFTSIVSSSTNDANHEAARGNGKN